VRVGRSAKTSGRTAEGEPAWIERDVARADGLDPPGPGLRLGHNSPSCSRSRMSSLDRRYGRCQPREDEDINICQGIASYRARFCQRFFACPSRYEPTAIDGQLVVLYPCTSAIHRSSSLATTNLTGSASDRPQCGRKASHTQASTRTPISRGEAQMGANLDCSASLSTVRNCKVHALGRCGLG
jgi:hypothetical protein